MLLEALIMVSLSGSGHWNSGEAANVQFTHAAPVQRTLVVDWRLTHGRGPIELAGGELDFEPGQAHHQLMLEIPFVRGQTDWTLQYRVRPDDARERAEWRGMPLRIYPDLKLKQHVERLDRPLVVVGQDAQNLSRLFEDRDVAHDHFERWRPLSVPENAVVLLMKVAAEDRVTRERWLRFVRRGGDVIVMGSTIAPDDADVAGVERQDPSAVQWKLDHPLLSDLDERALLGWLENVEDVRAIRFEPEARVDLIAYSLKDRDHDEHADALLAVQQVGQGRVIWMGLPVYDWREDARAQLMLRNVLDYLSGDGAPRDTLQDQLKNRDRASTQAGFSRPAQPASVGTDRSKGQRP